MSWSGWWDIKLREVSSATIGTKDPHSGGKYLKLGSDQTFKQNILQTVTGLANGRYTLEMWVRTSGGQNDLTLFALDYGGKELNLSVPKAQNLSWVKYTLPNINVTNGKATIGIWENAPAGLHYADVDDVALYREDATSP